MFECCYGRHENKQTEPPTPSGNVSLLLERNYRPPQGTVGNVTIQQDREHFGTFGLIYHLVLPLPFIDEEMVAGRNEVVTAQLGSDRLRTEAKSPCSLFQCDFFLIEDEKVIGNEFCSLSHILVHVSHTQIPACIHVPCGERMGWCCC
jgi:hypothetical protein